MLARITVIVFIVGSLVFMFGCKEETKEPVKQKSEQSALENPKTSQEEIDKKMQEGRFKASEPKSW